MSGSRDTTIASNPGQLELSDSRLRQVRPELYGIKGFFRNRKIRRAAGRTEREAIAEHLIKGDTRAAVVVSSKPCLIAAYTDEIDCVAMLWFEPKLARMHQLKVGDRLLTVNSYYREEHKDLLPGQNALNRWHGFHPIIADFLTDQRAALKLKKQRLPEEEWTRAQQLAGAYHYKYPQVCRDGRPFHSCYPVTAIR